MNRLEANTIDTYNNIESTFSYLGEEDIKDKSIKGKSVKDLIYNSYYVGDKEPLPTTSVNINSINKLNWIILLQLNIKTLFKYLYLISTSFYL